MITLKGGPADGYTVSDALFDRPLNRYIVAVHDPLPPILEYKPNRPIEPLPSSRLWGYMPDGTFEREYQPEETFGASVEHHLRQQGNSN